jgi:flagellar protein FlbT
MNISLRRGEKIYINGAVFRVDRKVCIELLNDVTFLLENHVMQAEAATTPLRQLYFVIQTMLMEPQDVTLATALYSKVLLSCEETFCDRRIVEPLSNVARLVASGRYFDALKIVRTLFPIEAEIIGPAKNEKSAA